MVKNGVVISDNDYYAQFYLMKAFLTAESVGIVQGFSNETGFVAGNTLL